MVVIEADLRSAGRSGHIDEMHFSHVLVEVIFSCETMLANPFTEAALLIPLWTVELSSRIRRMNLHVPVKIIGSAERSRATRIHTNIFGYRGPEED